MAFFIGPGLKHFGNRFQDVLKKQLSEIRIEQDLVELPALYSFMQDLLIGPAIETMCGPTLIVQNPTFLNDFRKFDYDLLYFFKSCPRWLAPRAWKNRDQIPTSLKSWHAFARDHFDESSIGEDGHDRFYGSPMMRSRQTYLLKMDSIDANALASQDLGLVWA